MALLLISGTPLVATFVAGAAAFLIIAVGMAVLGGLAQPVPEPPPPGELRKVRMTYRCDICGAEVRMTMAPTDDPEPPRHCQDDMRLTATIEDALQVPRPVVVHRVWSDLGAVTPWSPAGRRSATPATWTSSARSAGRQRYWVAVTMPPRMKPSPSSRYQFDTAPGSRLT